MKEKFDTLVMLLADSNGGKSSQMRSIFTEPELLKEYGGYPTQPKLRQTYDIHPDI